MTTSRFLVLRAELRNWTIKRNARGDVQEVEGDVWEDSANLWADGQRIKVQGMLTCSDYGRHLVIGEMGPGRSTYLLYKNSEKKRK